VCVPGQRPACKSLISRGAHPSFGKDGGLLILSGWFSLLAAALLSWLVANEGLRDLIGSSDGDAADAPAAVADRELLEAVIHPESVGGSVRWRTVLGCCLS
jgi:hypothetical protein